MKTNLTYAFRNIRNNSTNSIITVVGLSVAIACCLIIYFYVSQECNYNIFHKNADRIYRINYGVKYIDYEGFDVRLEPQNVDQLKKDIPQIEKCTEYRYAFEHTLSYKNIFFDVNTSYASEDFFSVFTFPFIAGSSDSIFNAPYEVVITRKLADKLLGTGNDYSSLVGKTVEYPLVFGNTAFKIDGVMEDIPKNSSMNFDAVVSGKTPGYFGGCDNYIGYTSIFYLVKENVDARETGKNVSHAINGYYAERVEVYKRNNQFKNTADAFAPFVLSLKDVYTHGEIDNCFERSVEKRNFVVLITIGLLILIIACSNYIILSLGQYLKKIGDVGIRKAMGANNRNIFGVFLAEGFMLTFASFVISVLLCGLFIPVFEKLSGTEILIQFINVPATIAFVLILFLTISVITSMVPVLVFSKVSPHQMASNKINIGGKKQLSQLFVSVQYSLSIILIIFTLFIVRQSNYLKNKSLGLDANNIIDVRTGRIDRDKTETFKTMLAGCPGIIDRTYTDRNFMNGSSNDYVNRGDGEMISVFRFRADDHYVSTLNLKLIQGKDFSTADIKPNNRNMLVNRKFTEAFGIGDDPIGKTYNISGSNYTILGVVDDYCFFDARRNVDPAMLFTSTNISNGSGSILVKYQPQQLNQVIDYIKKCYNEVAPGKTLTYDFWNDRLNQRYQTEERWSKIIGYSAVIAIIISSLGLFGLTVLLINQRIKEIGIRKVNGAKSVEVLLTINQSFFGWLTGSLIFAIPVSYLLVNSFLEIYVNKVSISWWIFIVSGLLAFLVALLTVSWQSWKAATRNPVEALRYE